MGKSDAMSTTVIMRTSRDDGSVAVMAISRLSVLPPITLVLRGTPAGTRNTVD